MEITKIRALNAQHQEDLEYLSSLDDEVRLKYSCEENMIEIIENYYWDLLCEFVYSKYTAQILNKYEILEVGRILLSLGKDDAICFMENLVKMGTVNKEDYSNFIDFINETGQHAQFRPQSLLTLEELEEMYNSKATAELIYRLTRKDHSAVQ